MAKTIWEKCRVTTINCTKAANNGIKAATCLFLTVGTTVPENVYRHVYGIIAANRAATLNYVSVFELPDGGKGTQYLMYQVPLADKNSGAQAANAFYPRNPDPMKPIMALEGGSKLYVRGATASVAVGVLYWDDILTGIESA
jgi:hypothetical protein